MRAAATAMLVFALAALAAAKGLTAEDLVAMRKVQQPVPSPDGTRYVVPVNVLDTATYKKTQNLWLGTTAPAAQDLTQLAAFEYASDSEPFWSKDGTWLFFLSTRAGSNDLWVVKPTAGAEPQRVTTFPVDIDSVKMSPDGSKIAFSASVYPGMTMAQTAARDKAWADKGINAMTFDRLFVRRWDDWFVGKFRHLHMAPIALSGGIWSVDPESATDLEPSFEGDTPSRPFGGADEYDWSPDSKQLAFTTQIGRDTAWSTDLNVYTVSAAAGATPKCITCANFATDTSPAYSPDGKYIAYLSMSIPAYESDLKHIKLYDRTTGTITPLTAEFDRSVESMKWAADSKSILCGVPDTSRMRLYRVSASTGQATMVLGDHHTDGAVAIPCSDSKSKTCVLYSRSDYKHPAEIFVTTSSGEAVQISRFTADQVASLELSDWEEFWYAGANNEMIHSWLFKPYGFSADKKFPLVLYIHGGPEDPWYDNFHYRWNPQTITAAGYAVLAPSFHGTASFGSNFTQSIIQDWGGKPFVDLMKGVDAVVAKYSWIDGTRVGAMGASYGGFMINWINSQTTRFKCLVCHDGLWDTAGQWFYTDELYFPEREFGAPAYADDRNYKKNSPSTFAANMVTPELVIHGSKDYRIPDVAGISVFTNLQRRGIESKLIIFPGENHWVVNPKHSVFWHTEIIAWLDKFLKN